ncbi:MAG: hypothetical protein Tsb0010_06270 [Parvularculaceae bacterium]
MRVILIGPIAAAIAGVAAACAPEGGVRDDGAREDATPPAAIDGSEPAAGSAVANALPGDDIYLFSLAISGDGAAAVSLIGNVTDRPGYDNQPEFLAGESAFLFTGESEEGRTDIWRYDIALDEISRVTNTRNIGEYSPRPTPDGHSISFIHEKEDRDRQQVYRARRDGSGAEPVLELSPVGYYAWNTDGSRLAMFALGDPPTLRVADLESGEIAIVYENIGRALYALPGGAGAVFTAPRDGDEGYSALRLDFADNSVTPLFDLPGVAQDYAIIPPAAASGGETGFLSAADDVLYIRMPPDAEWRAVADLSEHGVTGATRMAVSPDRRYLAVVGAAE